MNPVCPKVRGEANNEVGPFQSLAVGLSQPRPLRLDSYCCRVNFSSVEGLK